MHLVPIPIVCSVQDVPRLAEGCVQLRTFVGGAMQQNLFEQDDATMAASVRRELQQLLEIPGGLLETEVRQYRKLFEDSGLVGARPRPRS